MDTTRLPGDKSQSKANSENGLKKPYVPPSDPEDRCGNQVCEEDPETRCGISWFKPRCLQFFARVEWFTFFFSLCALITSTLNVYVNSQITTMERQFGFSSSQTGIIMAANDLGYLVCVLFVSYSASYVHVPRSLGISTIIFAVTGLFCSLPFFVFIKPIKSLVTSFEYDAIRTVPGKRNTFFGDLCVVNGTEGDICGVTDDSDSEISSLPVGIVTTSLAMIVMGMMLQGCAKSPRTSFTVTYIDNNTRHVNTGLHLGIMTTSAALGPVTAFLAGGFVSEIFVTLEDTNLTPRHPRWIGAWWLGYVLCGVLAFLCALPMMLFPRRLPSRKNRLRRPSESGSVKGQGQPLMQDKKGSTQETTEESAKGITKVLEHIKSFMVTSFRLMINPLYVAIVLGTCFELFGFAGVSTYLPKYVENAFNLPVRTANYLMAGRSLIGGAIGILLGGYMTKRFKMTPYGTLMLTTVGTFLALIFELAGFMLSCDQPTIQNWPGTPKDCNGACDCEDNSYFAICGSDGETYYSPCAAGCEEISAGMYQNCTCIPGDGMAVGGMCTYGCDYLYPFISASVIRMLCSSITIVPRTIVAFRCVSPKDKGLAVGINSFSQSCLGWLAGPVAFGMVIDGVCSIWDINSCDGTTGRCLLYDNNKFRNNFFALSCSSVAISFLLLVFAVVYVKRTGKFVDAEEEEFTGSKDNNKNLEFEVKVNGSEKSEKNIEKCRSTKL